MGLGGIIGGVIGAIGANKAAKKQERAANNQIAFQKETRDLIFDRYQPFLDAGSNYLNAYNYEMFGGEAPTINGQAYGGFEMSPGQQFRLDQAQDAIEGSAAASGGLFSGATAKALQSNAMGLSNQYRDNYLNRLAGGVDMGMQAAGGQANAATNAASGVQQAYGNLGNAQAAGAIGVTNALTGGLNNQIGLWNYQNQTGGSGIGPIAGALFG